MPKKRNIFILMLIAIVVFFIGNDVANADSLMWKKTKIECIYSDGGAYSFSWSVDLTSNEDISVINRNTYNLEGADVQQAGSSSIPKFVNSNVNSDHKCMKFVRRASIKEKDEDDNNVTNTYYKFGDEEPKFTTSNFEGESWWDWLFHGGMSAEEKKTAANKGQIFHLVSERVLLSAESGTPNHTLTYRMESSQASGSDSYAYIMVYDNAVLLKTKAKTTILEGDTDRFKNITIGEDGKVTGIDNKDVIYINNPEPFSSADSSGVPSYYYRQDTPRYKYSKTGPTSAFDRKYVLFNVGDAEGDAPDDGLCDVIMPETSKVLKRVIKIAQILVPVFLIVFTGIEIGRIVMSGNIEDDLPKMKKRIITRMVVAAIFFFLPLLTIVVLDQLRNSGAVEAEDIKDIRCLFED